ncbi:hypothetical protein Pla52o_43740 [Novipirellula galeiformis]|uniref:Uncharacterized protein n=1 Tax=Novipirellula galeiformis TaxID=2528004 RepID=A0A5C6CAT2_9BACT|nr:hypothetical protein Pla52o_43740 [Novipirellula galeiformis]
MLNAQNWGKNVAADSVPRVPIPLCWARGMGEGLNKEAKQGWVWYQDSRSGLC